MDDGDEFTKVVLSHLEATWETCWMSEITFGFLFEFLLNVCDVFTVFYTQFWPEHNEHFKNHYYHNYSNYKTKAIQWKSTIDIFSNLRLYNDNSQLDSLYKIKWRDLGVNRAFFTNSAVAIRGSTVLLLCSKMKIEMYALLPPHCLAYWNLFIKLPFTEFAMFSLWKWS